MTTTGKLSPQFSKLALQFAGENVPGFTEFCALPSDPRLALDGITDQYIMGTENVADSEKRRAEADLLKGLLAGDTRRRTLVIGKEISSLLLPMCAAYTKIEREKEESRLADFNKITEPYVDLASFIVEQARSRPPRLTILMARGLLLSFGLGTAMGSQQAAAIATIQAKRMVYDKLVDTHSINDHIETRVRHINEYEQGVGFLERFIGCTTSGARAGYEALGTAEPFEHVVQTVAKKYNQLDAKKATTVATEEVSRRTGYVLAKIL